MIIPNGFLMMNRENYQKILKYIFLFLFFLCFCIFLYKLVTFSYVEQPHGFYLGALLFLVSLSTVVLFLLFVRIGHQRISPVFLDYILDRFLLIEIMLSISLLGIILIFCSTFFTFSNAILSYLTLFFECFAIPALLAPLYVFIVLYPLLSPRFLINDMSRHIITNLSEAFLKNDYSSNRKAIIVKSFRYLGAIVIDSIRKKQIFDEGIHSLYGILTHYQSLKDTGSKGWFYIEASHFPNRTQSEIEKIVEMKLWFESMILDTFQQILESMEGQGETPLTAPLWEIPESMIEASLSRNDTGLLKYLLYFYRHNLLETITHEDKVLFLSLLDSYQRVFPQFQREVPSLLETVILTFEELTNKAVKRKASMIPFIAEQIRLFNESCVTLDILNRETYLMAFFQLTKSVIESLHYSPHKSIIYPLVSELLLLGKFYRTVNEEELLTIFKQNINSSPFIEIIREVQFLKKGLTDQVKNKKETKIDPNRQLEELKDQLTNPE